MAPHERELKSNTQLLYVGGYLQMSMNEQQEWGVGKMLAIPLLRAVSRCSKLLDNSSPYVAENGLGHVGLQELYLACFEFVVSWPNFEPFRFRDD